MNIPAQRIPKFKKWLEQNGAEVLPATNDYEALRFRVPNGTGVVYSNERNDKCKPSNDLTIEAYNCYSKNISWSKRPVKVQRLNRSKTKKQLIARDGCTCFFCTIPLTKENITEEHLLSLVHGGNNRLENKVLACNDCNDEVGNMPVGLKIEFTIMKRAQALGQRSCKKYCI